MASDEKIVITEEVLEIKGRGLMNITVLKKKTEKPIHKDSQQLESRVQNGPIFVECFLQCVNGILLSRLIM